MPPKKIKAQFSISTIILIAVLCALLIGCIVIIFFQQKTKVNVPTSPPENNKICLTLDQYNSLQQQKISSHIVPQPSRDRRVLEDPLQPPLNRAETQTHQNMVSEVKHRNMYVPSAERPTDQFRLVGYLTSKDHTAKDAGGNHWKLFARQKDRHSSEFYIVPTNNNYDIKIAITDDIVKGVRLRDLYTIPNEISFNTPMLNTTPYEFVEIPKTDFTTTPNIYT